MFHIKYIIFYHIILNIFFEVQALVEIPSSEDSYIIKTESAIRNSINSLFSGLQLRHVKHKTRLKEYVAIHNFFATITLQDHDSLKEIARLARADNIDNKTHIFITQLNEVLNEDDKRYEATDDVYVTTHIETFIRKLEYLKYKFGFQNNAAGFGINKEIMKHLNSGENVLQNVTGAVQVANDSDDNILSDIEFWRDEPSGRRIFEGQREKIKRFPFMASVQFFKKFQCGGSIIKSDLVITAASCLQLAWNNRFFRENPSFLSVQVGCDMYEGGDENIAVLEVNFHPNYNPRNLMNNLAIMRLSRVLKFGRTVRNIKKIDFDRDAWPMPHTTAGITVVGWGARTITNVIKDPWSNRLSYADLDFYPLKECQEVYSKEYVTFRNFCAGYFSRGGGACSRDVGGPGVAHGILVGVVSFGSPTCGAPDAPTVFTKLGYYTDWIEGIMEKRGVTSRVATTERTSMVTYNRISAATEYEYTLQPVSATDEELHFTTVPPSALPVRSIDPLRILSDNHKFKEFLTTMFGSDEVKEYLEQYDYDEAKSASQQNKEVTRTKDIPTTMATTAKDDFEDQIPPNTDKKPNQADLVKMVTTLDNFDRLESYSVEVDTMPSMIEKYTSLDVVSAPKKSNIEADIAKLIDEIDIQKLMESDSTDEAGDKLTQLIEEAEQQNQKETVVKLNESEETDGSTSDEDDDDNESGAQLLSLLDDNNNNNKKEHREEGLSIPVDSFKDLTFRQNNSGNDILDLLSQKDIMALFTGLVAEASKKKTYKLI